MGNRSAMAPQDISPDLEIALRISKRRGSANAFATRLNRFSSIYLANM